MRLGQKRAGKKRRAEHLPDLDVASGQRADSARKVVLLEDGLDHLGGGDARRV